MSQGKPANMEYLTYGKNRERKTGTTGETDKKTILAVDDAETNRAFIKKNLKKEYKVVTADSGEEAIELMYQSKDKIDLILLETEMQDMNGFDFMEIMNRNKWLDDTPVIMVIPEYANKYVKKIYEAGALDFVRFPFDTQIVRRRIHNAILLSVKQKRMKAMVASQIIEKEKNNTLMLAILSHIVEFRNGESGLHVLNINTLTELLLECLLKKTNKYRLQKSDIPIICMASSLHDIGKVMVPDEILNKPGRLTEEEFEIIKQHSLTGTKMIEDVPYHQNERLIKYAREICRWHHERWDGNGYPDGLKGDEIPISAQIVSIADVYDALTSERCYKKAYSHEKAMEMIFGGECGQFNPLILECLKEIEGGIQKELKLSSLNGGNSTRKAAQTIMDKMEGIDGEKMFGNTYGLFEDERAKVRYISSLLDGCYFEYNKADDILIFEEKMAEQFGFPRIIRHPLVNTTQGMSPVYAIENYPEFLRLVRSTTPKKPGTDFETRIMMQGKLTPCRIHCRTFWAGGSASREYVTLAGEIRLLTQAAENKTEEFER